MRVTVTSRDLRPQADNKMNKPSSSDGVSTGRNSGFLALLALLLVVLAALFYKSFTANQVLFSNDGPLGIISSTCKVTDFRTAVGVWQDLNWLGSEDVSGSPNLSMFILMLLKPLLYAKFAAPIGLLLLGLSAWLFFRQLRLAPIACVLGGLATALNSDFFSTACWGIVAQSLCIASNFLALAALARVAETSRSRSWIRVLLAGLAVGMGVMQGWDVGALFSLVVAAYVLYQALFMDEASSDIGRQMGRGIGRVVIVAAAAALISTATLTSLVGTQIGGVSGMAQDEATREARWQQATEWSLPKKEILQLVVPGLFGYRNYWHMYDDQQPKDDQYWGVIGESGDGSFWRLSGTGLYAGVFVVMVSLWAILQSLRRAGSPFSTNQRRALWFWAGVLVVTALLGFGKYLPFLYRLFYALPYASTIRNPTKFLHVFSWALVIVFAYGMHGLYKAFMEKAADQSEGLVAQFKAWWAGSATFDRAWLAGCVFSVGIAIVAWIIYAGKLDELVKYLPTVGIPEDQAAGVAHFSIASVGWLIAFLVLAIALSLFIFIGRLSGPNAAWGGALIGVLLLVDLGRADQPWIIYWNTAFKYAEDPIINFLADKPHEHRVGALIWADPKDQQSYAQFQVLYTMYGTAWKQHLFWYHDIQCVDIVQEPRVGTDKTEFMMGLRPDSSNPQGLLREWELTGTRYLLGVAGIVPFLNQQLDPQKQRFRIARLPDGRPATFRLALKPGAPPFDPSSGVDLTSRSADFITVIDPNGPLGLIEFTGALPRASLIPHWEVNTNDEETLQTVANPAFDPSQTVMVADTIPAPPPPGPTAGTGSVAITSYAPKRIALAADINSPCVLLMADRYNPKWKVTVDGKPEQVLRCNFVERGVYLEPGKHEVVFSFSGDCTTFVISFATLIVGVLLCGWLALTEEPDPAPTPETPEPATVPGSQAKPQTGAGPPKKKTRKN
jgi:hypothetical protein